VFVESPRFPDELAYGAVGGPSFHTQVHFSPSGAEYREQQWPLGPAVYDVSLVHRDESLIRELLAFFRCIAKGQANGFRFHDFQPGESSGEQELLGYGDGEQRTWQLLKQYEIGGLSYARTILKPVPGTTVAFVNDVPLEAGQFFVDSRSGRLTLFTPPALDVPVRATFEFDVPVRFTTDWLAIRAVAPRAWTWDGITLQEIRPDVETPTAIFEGWEWNNPFEPPPIIPLWTSVF
jgi:uncharacterized protein (TIGR02217 family)